MSEYKDSTPSAAGHSPQPFAEAAPLYERLGLRTFPVRRDKVPAVQHWRNFGTGSYRKLLATHANCNLGVVNARPPRPLVVVDIDDPDERDWCEERFGDTPVKVRTPSGGEHWFYEGQERRRTRFEGHRVDILGTGGYGVLPPSYTAAGAYEFIEGRPEDFLTLPTLSVRASNDREPYPTKSPREMRDGDGRNRMLFDSLRSTAADIIAFDELLEVAHERNREFAETMSDEEIRKVASSVWQYKQRGELMSPGCESRVVTPISVIEACMEVPDSYFLWAKLKQLHGHKGTKPFSLPTATGRRIMEWGSKERFWRARDHLFATGLLICVQAGEKGSRRPTKVRFPALPPAPRERRESV